MVSEMTSLPIFQVFRFASFRDDFFSTRSRQVEQREDHVKLHVVFAKIVFQEVPQVHPVLKRLNHLKIVQQMQDLHVNM